MKSILAALGVPWLALALASAADNPRLSRLLTADDARVAATLSASRAGLDATLSEDLHYAHSNGAVDSKASYIGLVASGRSRYLVYDYVERNFTFPEPGIALMSGRVHVKSTSADGDKDHILSFLAVWREEQGTWRFLAWQSCSLPPKKP